MNVDYLWKSYSERICDYIKSSGLYDRLLLLSQETFSIEITDVDILKSNYNIKKVVYTFEISSPSSFKFDILDDETLILEPYRLKQADFYGGISVLKEIDNFKSNLNIKTCYYIIEIDLSKEEIPDISFMLSNQNILLETDLNCRIRYPHFNYKIDAKFDIDMAEYQLRSLFNHKIYYSYDITFNFELYTSMESKNYFKFISFIFNNFKSLGMPRNLRFNIDYLYLHNQSLVGFLTSLADLLESLESSNYFKLNKHFILNLNFEVQNTYYDRKQCAEVVYQFLRILKFSESIAVGKYYETVRWKDIKGLAKYFKLDVKDIKYLLQIDIESLGYSLDD